MACSCVTLSLHANEAKGQKMKTQHLHGLPVVAFHELGKNLGKILTRSWGNHGKITLVRSLVRSCKIIMEKIL